MSHVVAIAGAIVAGIFFGIAAAAYIPFLKNRKTDTAFLLKKAGTAAKTNFHLYSPVVLRGTLWVCSGCLVVMLKTLLEWKSSGVVQEIDVKILWVGVAATAVDKWLTFMDTTVARFRDEKKKINDTTPPIPPEDGRLKTLG